MIRKDFFNRDTITVAKDLLGKIIIRNDGDISYKAKIVETEAYLGLTDRAAHTFSGKITDRNRVMYGEAGTIYVYQTYGIHFLMNFVTLDSYHPEAVLIRAVEPMENINQMAFNRFSLPLDELSSYQMKNLSNGPGKLTKALSIDKSLNNKNLFTKEIYLIDNDEEFDIVTDVRIGIDYAKEAIDYPYRFYIKSNPHVSVLKKEENDK